MSTVWITGDFEGDISRLSEERFPEQVELDKSDYVILLGGTGFLSDNSKENQQVLDNLNNLPFTTLLIDGDGDSPELLQSAKFKLIKFNGGKARQLRESVLYLERGYIFNLNNKTFFTMGGARSTGIDDGVLFKVNYNNSKELKAAYKKAVSEGLKVKAEGIDWWEAEIPSKKEMELGTKNLSDAHYNVDFVISHTCPKSIEDVFKLNKLKTEKTSERKSIAAFKRELAARDGKAGKNKVNLVKIDLTTDPTQAYLDEICGTVLFKKWFFGHYHANKQILNDFIMLYDRVLRIV